LWHRNRRCLWPWASTCKILMEHQKTIKIIRNIAKLILYVFAYQYQLYVK
jgi:hypothetical protein